MPSEQPPAARLSMPVVAVAAPEPEEVRNIRRQYAERRFFRGRDARGASMINFRVIYHASGAKILHAVAQKRLSRWLISIRRCRSLCGTAASYAELAGSRSVTAAREVAESRRCLASTSLMMTG